MRCSGRLGPLFFGLDLTTWGLGLVVALSYPRGLSAHVGPFFMKMEGSDLADWFRSGVDTLGDFVVWQLEKLDNWVEKRRRGRSGK